jgi:hypothetical protein
MTFNEITAVRSNTDKSGNEFKTLTLSCTTFNTLVHPVTGATVNALGSSTNQTLNAWSTGVDSPYNHLFNATVGTAVVGNLETREVEAYQIEDNIAGQTTMRTVNTYTCFVAEDPTSARYEQAVRNAFRWNGHNLATEDAPAATIEVAAPAVDFGA